MEKVRLGRTELMVTKTSFGALPIQRISKGAAVKLASTISIPPICIQTVKRSWEQPSTMCGSM